MLHNTKRKNILGELSIYLISIKASVVVKWIGQDKFLVLLTHGRESELSQGAFYSLDTLIHDVFQILRRDYCSENEPFCSVRTEISRDGHDRLW